jgi:hypothetical protein
MAALGLIGQPTLQAGFQNAAKFVPAGMDANAAWQKSETDRLDRQKRSAAMNAWMRSQSGFDQSPEEQAIVAESPEVGEALFGASLKRRFEPQETYRPLTDPAERARFGIPETDTAPYQIGPDNKVSAVSGGGTNVNVNTGDKLTEGQSKDVNFYARGRSADAELTPDLEKALTNLPESLWSSAPVIGNYAVSPQFQTAKRAASEFLAVVLRKDTGAAVTPAEFELYGPMYLPVPGDSDQVLEAKRNARKKVIDSIKLGLGTARGMADEIDQTVGSEPPPEAEMDGVVDWQTYFGGQ